MLQSMELQGMNVIADRGYDMNNILKLLDEKQAKCGRFKSKTSQNERKCDWWLYKERHLVECLFNKLKHDRRLATRYDKLSCTFGAF
ncbi:transposase [Paenibacillus sp. FSL R7-0198]|uniref:transposase n=1 Tax=Paenibacillus sp. FSL R7-0198 TaxID=2921674 RepID=UPI0030FA5437